MSTTTDTIDTAIVAEYMDMWRETDEAARADRIARVFTEDGRHVDPNADARGHAGLAEMITAVHATYPGFTMRQTTGVDAHNDQLRFGWELQSADGSLTLAGRLRRITGFWGELS